jgi:hypothetical protein
MDSSKHHLYGPSSLERRSLCPWSAKAEMNLPEDTNPYAEAGTRIHAAAAAYVMGQEPPKLESMEEQEAFEGIAAYWDRFRASHEVLTVQAERRVAFKTPWGEEIYHGTVDVIANCADGVWIIDWKTGRRKVEDAGDNWQGAGYALSVMQECKLTEVNVIFFNPVARQETTARFDDMDTLFSQINGVLQKCEAASSADAVPGETQCRYCKAAKAGTCIMWLRWSMQHLNVLSAKLEDWPDDIVSTELRRISEAQKFMDVLKAEAIRRAEANGGRCGSLELREKSGARKVEDIDAVHDKVADVIGPDRFLSLCTIPVGKLETAWVEARKAMEPDRKLKVVDLKNELSGLCGDAIGRGAPTKELVFKEAEP